jgi:ABC-type Fe3+ transport system permease subunit
VVATVLAVTSIVAIVRLNSRLHAARNRIVLTITLAVYAIQLGYGVTLISSPHNNGPVANLAYVLFATLLVSLPRAWSLLRGTHLRQPADADSTAERSGEQGATA